MSKITITSMHRDASRQFTFHVSGMTSSAVAQNAEYGFITFLNTDGTSMLQK
jgi:hypothetical protein